MLLCLICGRAEDHDVACPSRVPSPTSPDERAERVRRAVGFVVATVAGSDKVRERSPVEALLRVLSGERMLDRYPSSDLSAYDQKRAWNDASTRLAAKRAELVAALPDGEGKLLVEDFPFAKLAVERLFALTCRRLEAQRFDASALAGLPLEPLASASASPPPLKQLCTELEERLAAGRALDAEVTNNGWDNLKPLMRGDAPAPEPEAPGYLGALLGRGAATRRAAARTGLKLLGDRFRERLYLIGANTILLQVVSRLAQAEDAWRRQVAKDEGAARWARLQETGGPLLRYVLGDQEGLPGKVEDVVARLAGGSKAVAPRALAPFGEIRPDEWEAYAMSYFFELDAVMGNLSSRDVGISGVAAVLIGRRPGQPADAYAVSRALQNVRDTWRARPPRPSRSGS